MLTEISRVAQLCGEPARRWFVDKDLDLIVWLDEQERIIGFQLCYRDSQQECAVDWRPTRGLEHYRVDVGEARPGRHKAAPVMLPAPQLDLPRLCDLFEERADTLEPALARFICRHLRTHH